MSGADLRALRARARLTAQSVAEQIGVSRPRVSQWESMERPPTSAVSRIVRAIGELQGQ